MSSLIMLFQLEELPSSFADLQRLQWLDLYSNNFENIPPCIDTLINNLSGLDIDYNLFELEAAVKEKVCKGREFGCHL